MNWEYVTLDKMGSVSRGKSKHRPRNDPSLFGGPYPFIQTADVKDAPFYITRFNESYNEKGLEQSKLWNKGTLCITIAANIADTAILGIDACFPDSIMGFIPYKGVSDVRFIKYAFDMLQNSVKQISQGTAQDNLSWQKLSTIKFPKPPYKVQKKIADYLVTYEDLIENNQKQIKLLEEAAQRLYKEWFVDMRFPGYEDVQIVDGVPEGWKKTTIENKCTLKKTIVHPEETQTGTAYIGLEHIPRHDFCLSNWGDASEVSSNKYIYNQKDIIFGQIRPYFHKVGFAINDGVASTDSFIMKPDERCWGLFLLTVSSDAFVQFAYQTCKEGAKMPRADWRQMKEYPLLIPGASLLCRFETFVAEITDKIRTIALQNRYLTEARNRLLPKLMSGEIEL